MGKNENQNPILIIFVVVLVAVGGYFIFKNETGNKIACSDHLNSSHALVNEMYPSVANIPFDKYFYSPKLDTCVAGIVKKENISGENKAHTSYLILDTLNNKEIWFYLGTQYHQPQGEHETEMTQSDTEQQGEYYSELSKLR